MTTTADKVWWTRPGFIAATAFLLLVTILAIWISTSSNGTDVTGEPPTPTATSTGSAQTGGSNTTVSTAGSPPSSATELELTEAPANITWTLWQGIALPSSPDDGLADVHDGIAESYTHTPAGALIASTQITNRYTFGNSHTIAERQFAAGAGRDIMVARAKDGVGDTTKAAQTAGFKFVSYSGDNAVLFLAVKYDTGLMQAGLVTLQWVNEDWRLVPSPAGELFSGAQPLTSLSGYVTWAGVS